MLSRLELTDAEQREFIIKDNVGYGEWDMDALANEWDTEELVDWGLDLWEDKSDSESGNSSSSLPNSAPESSLFDRFVVPRSLSLTPVKAIGKTARRSGTTSSGIWEKAVMIRL